MESEATQSAWFYQAWAWTEAHRKQVIGGAIALLVVGLAAGIYVWQQNQKQVNANDALSQVMMRGFTASGVQEPLPDALVKVAAEHPDTDAGGRALLLAGANFFDAGKFADAQAQFEKFLRDYRETPFSGEALLGVAACQDAQGKTGEAITSYQNIITRQPTDPIVPQAKFALARLYETQGKLVDARNLYEDLARVGFTSIGSEAGMLYEELIAQNPQLAPTNRPAGNVPSALNLKNP